MKAYALAAVREDTPSLKPHRVRYFKVSKDPDFVHKLRDRTQPSLPMKKGRAGTMTHDYKRNGLATLFAAHRAGASPLEGSRTQVCLNAEEEIDRWTPDVRA